MKLGQKWEIYLVVLACPAFRGQECKGSWALCLFNVALEANCKYLSEGHKKYTHLKSNFHNKLAYYFYVVLVKVEIRQSFVLFTLESQSENVLHFFFLATSNCYLGVHIKWQVVFEIKIKIKHFFLDTYLIFAHYLHFNAPKPEISRIVISNYLALSIHTSNIANMGIHEQIYENAIHECQLIRVSKSHKHC